MSFNMMEVDGWAHVFVRYNMNNLWNCILLLILRTDVLLKQSHVWHSQSMEAYFIVKQPCNTFYNLKYTNMLLRYSVAAPHGLCVLSHLFSVSIWISWIVGNAHVQCWKIITFGYNAYVTKNPNAQLRRPRVYVISNLHNQYRLLC